MTGHCSYGASGAPHRMSRCSRVTPTAHATTACSACCKAVCALPCKNVEVSCENKPLESTQTGAPYQRHCSHYMPGQLMYCCSEAWHPSPGPTWDSTAMCPTTVIATLRTYPSERKQNASQYETRGFWIWGLVGTEAQAHVCSSVILTRALQADSAALAKKECGSVGV